jgi:hypothetical protein
VSINTHPWRNAVVARSSPDAETNYTIPEFAKLQRRSPSFIYNEIAAGRLHALKIGRGTIITAGERRRYEASLAPFVSRARRRSAE